MNNDPTPTGFSPEQPQQSPQPTEQLSSPFGAPVQPSPAPAPASAPGPAKKNAPAIISLVLGVISIFFGFLIIGLFFGIAAIILGVVSKKEPGGKGLRIAGIVTGSIGIFLSIAAIIFVSLVLVPGGPFAVKEVPYNDYGQAERDAESRALIAAKKDFAKGETARIGNFDVKVNGIQDNYMPSVQPVRSDYDNAFTYSTARSVTNPSAGNRFIIIDLTMTNKSTKPDRLLLLAVNADGKDAYTSNTFTSLETAVKSSSAGVLVPSQPEYIPLDLTFDTEPGLSKSGKLIYEIPAGATNLKLSFTMNGVYNPETEGQTDLKFTLAL